MISYVFQNIRYGTKLHKLRPLFYAFGHNLALRLFFHNGYVFV